MLSSKKTLNIMNNQIDWSTTLIRASAMGAVMTDPRSKTELLSQTCKTYLRQLYRELKYGVRKEITSKYFDKGNLCEEDGITLYSRYKQRMFKKNDERISNKFFIGEPDFYDGPNILAASHIYDIKNAWDLFTFPFPDDDLNKDYFFQAQTYMSLTGATEATFVYTLNDTPEFLINKEINNIFYKTGIEATEKQVANIKNNMTFSDKMSIEERVIEFNIKRDDDIIKKMEDRVNECREYLISLDNSFKK